MITYESKHNATEIAVSLDGRHVGTILAQRFGWWIYQPLAIARDIFDSSQYTREWRNLAVRRDGKLPEIKKSFAS